MILIGLKTDPRIDRNITIMSDSAIKCYNVTVRFYTPMGKKVCRSWKIEECTGVIIPHTPHYDLGWNVYDSYENAQKQHGLIASVCSESFCASIESTLCQTTINSVVLLNDETREPTSSEALGDFDYDSDSD